MTQYCHNKKWCLHKVRFVVFVITTALLLGTFFAQRTLACCVTSADLWVGRSILDAGDKKRTSIGTGEGCTVFFHGQCEVERDSEARPIKYTYDFGDGDTYIKYTYSSTSGPTDPGSYYTYTSHMYSSTNEYTVTVTIERLDAPGCLPRTATCQVKVLCPSGEFTTVDDPPWDYLVTNHARFVGTVTPTGVDLSGLWVYEDSPPDGGLDDCYYEGSKQQPWDKVTGGWWKLIAGNLYDKPDYIGWDVPDVNYYREHPDPPRACCTYIIQDMYLDCGTCGSYKRNDLFVFIYSEILRSERDDVATTRNWPVCNCCEQEGIYTCDNPLWAYLETPKCVKVTFNGLQPCPDRPTPPGEMILSLPNFDSCGWSGVETDGDYNWHCSWNPAESSPYDLSELILRVGTDVYFSHGIADANCQTSFTNKFLDIGDCFPNGTGHGYGGSATISWVFVSCP